MWRYEIFNDKAGCGVLTHNGRFESTGYSGTGEGRNNVAEQEIPNVGPIPVGLYKIGAAYDDPHLGPCVMHLDPVPPNNAFGRSLFRIHGDNAKHDASHGCIILGPAVRKLIAESYDPDLEVVP